MATTLLKQTLKEEKAADEKLSALAESEINIEAEEEDAPRASRPAGGISALFDVEQHEVIRDRALAYPAPSR